MRAGNAADFKTAGVELSTKTSADQINRVRGDISGQLREAGPYIEKALKHLGEKRGLIEFIIQLNKLDIEKLLLSQSFLIRFY
jgi:hypothetical protein